MRLEVCGLEWPLRAEIPLDDFVKVLEVIHFLSRYVDFEGMGRLGRGGPVARAGSEWSREELEAFLRERNEAQKAFLAILAERGEITRTELLEELRSRLGRRDYSGRDLAGVVAGINRRAASLGKESLFEIERRRVGGKLDGFYRLKDRYRSLLLELLSGGTGKP